MPVFEITSPQGIKYEITAPDGATEEQAMRYAQSAISSGDLAPSNSINSPIGNDAGATNAFVYGANEVVPFGNKITGKIGAAGAKAYDFLSGENNLSESSLSDLYQQSLQDAKSTNEAHPVANLAGNLTGIAALLPMGVSRSLFGEIPTAGTRGLINEIPKATTALSDFARRGEIAGGGALRGAANLTLRSAKGGALAAPTGALYGAGSSDEGDVLGGAESGAKFGASIGAGAPVLGSALGALSSSVIPKIEEPIAKLADRAKQLGIKLSVDQIAPTPFRNTIQKVSQEVPLSGAKEFQETQKKDFMRALSRTIGLDSDKLGGEEIKKFSDNAREAFSKALGDKPITFAPSDLAKIQDIIPQARGEITEDLVKIVQNNVNKFIKDSEFEFGKGRIISPEKLSSLRSEIIKKLPSISGGAKQHVAKLIDVIDDAAQRQITPEQAEALKVARRQWRNYKTIDQLLEKSSDGTVNPTELINRVAASPYIDASKSAVGDDDLVDLARIGKQFLVKKGGSDTAQKSALLLGGGGLATLLATNPAAAITAILGGIGATGANRALQGLNRSEGLVKKTIQKSLKKNINKGSNLTLPKASALGILTEKGD